MTVRLKPTEHAVFTNVDHDNIVTNGEGEEVTVTAGFYTLSEILALLNTMSNAEFTISPSATSFGCLVMTTTSPVNFTYAPDLAEIFGLGEDTIIGPGAYAGNPETYNGTNVLDITRNRQVIQVYSTLARSADLKIANQQNNLLTTMFIDNPQGEYLHRVEEVAIPIVQRFDRLRFLFRDFDGNILNLNADFEIQLTVEDTEATPSTPAAFSQFSMTQVCNNASTEVKLDNPLSFSQCFVSNVTVYTDFKLLNLATTQTVIIDAERSGETTVTIPPEVYEIEDVIARLIASNALFELIYEGENAFHVTVNNFFTIDMSAAPEIMQILGFADSVLTKGTYNQKRYFLSSSCNRMTLVVDLRPQVFEIPTCYYKFDGTTTIGTVPKLYLPLAPSNLRTK